jgi:hypothetical protein
MKGNIWQSVTGDCRQKSECTDNSGACSYTHSFLCSDSPHKLKVSYLVTNRDNGSSILLWGISLVGCSECFLPSHTHVKSLKTGRRQVAYNQSRSYLDCTYTRSAGPSVHGDQVADNSTIDNAFTTCGETVHVCLVGSTLDTQLKESN